MKKKTNIKGIVLIIGTLVTILLAGIVIYTSLVIEKKGSVPIVPNAPESQPKAGEVRSCTLTFTVPGPTCTPRPACLDATPPCEIPESVDMCPPSPSPSATPIGTPSATPSATPTISPTPTATPSPTPPLSCDNSCTTNANCQSGLTCSDGHCRQPLCTGNSNCLCPTPSPTPPAGCNNSCSTNSDCASGMTCSNSQCRSSSCVESPNCVCASTSTPVAKGSPTPRQELPKSGSTMQTATVLGLGSIVTILGIIGFFAL